MKFQKYIEAPQQVEAYHFGTLEDAARFVMDRGRYSTLEIGEHPEDFIVTLRNSPGSTPLYTYTIKRDDYLLRWEPQFHRDGYQVPRPPRVIPGHEFRAQWAEA